MPINRFNPFPPGLAKTKPFIILLCLMPNNFTHQWRASGWERVNWANWPAHLPSNIGNKK